MALALGISLCFGIGSDLYLLHLFRDEVGKQSIYLQCRLLVCDGFYFFVIGLRKYFTG